MIMPPKKLKARRIERRPAPRKSLKPKLTKRKRALARVRVRRRTRLTLCLSSWSISHP